MSSRPSDFRRTLACPSIALAIAAVACAPVLCAITGLLPGVAFLQPNEQLHMLGLNDVTVRNGPDVIAYMPFVTRATRRKGTKLDETQYMIVTNTLTAEDIAVAGPVLYFLK